MIEQSGAGTGARPEPPSKLFLTGASGFIGARLAARLREAGHQVVGLSRSARPAIPGAGSGSFRWVEAELLRPDTYRDALASADTVLHLAAATGRASRSEHFKVNLEGTRCLLEACRELGVPRFLFCSTIAVKYPDRRRYYYAQAKATAEQAVRESGLEHVIVRPTIVVGSGSPVLEGLRKLAELPIIPVFGPGDASVQPVFVDDLVDLIVAITERGAFDGQVMEFGGPEILSIEAFIQAIRRRVRGRAGRPLHVPLPLLLPTLAALETVAYRFLPITFGQLSAFRFDGTARSNDLFEQRRGRMKGVREMLEASLDA